MYHDENSLRAMLDRRYPVDAPFEVARLAGGVSSLVFMAHGARGMRFVVKQALAELAVAEHWPAPRGRVFNEVRAMQVTRELAGADCVPDILFVEQADFLYAMEAVPAEAVLLKTAMLSGSWNPRWLGAAGAMLGSFHRGSAARAPTLKPDFGDILLFDSLRLDPYFRHAARVRPEFEGVMDRALTAALSNRRTLVHGDFSPKNIFVMPDDGRLILLDFEVAHWGNPAFDVAFFLTHCLAKAIHLPAQAKKLAEGIALFWNSYAESSGPSRALEEDVVLLWGAISIARVAGKSPLEYLKDEREKQKLLSWGEELGGPRAAAIGEVASHIARGK